MDGKDLLRRKCEDLGIEFESTFFFKTSQAYLKRGKRIQQQYNPNEISDKEYIIRYYPMEDIFFAWIHVRGRNSCSFKVPNDFTVQEGEIVKAAKKRGDNVPETVFAFKSTGVAKFLTDIVLDNN